MLCNLFAKAQERKERGVILYYSPQTRAFPVLWTLEELAVEYELKIVNLKQAEQKEDEYRRLNPMMKVPALTDGDVVVQSSTKRAPRRPSIRSARSRRAWALRTS
jgi:glutathione S-transferase